MDKITMKDGTQIYYKDWGTGWPVVFSHGWPLSADAWDDQMLFLGEHGYRVIAHDRWGHGRSSQPWSGNDMDTYWRPSADQPERRLKKPMNWVTWTRQTYSRKCRAASISGFGLSRHICKPIDDQAGHDADGPETFTSTP